MGTIQYDPDEDNFDIRTMYGSESGYNPNPGFAQSNGRDTRLKMTKLLAETGSRPGSRVTRNPLFHASTTDEDYILPGSRTGSVDYYQPMKETSEYIKERPYFLDKTTMRRLKQILTLAVCSGTVPWRFNTKTHQIDRWNPFFENLWKVQWFLVTIQTACLTVYQFHTFLSGVETNVKSYREVFMSSVSCYWYVCAVYFNINLYLHKDHVSPQAYTIFSSLQFCKVTSCTNKFSDAAVYQHIVSV